jgi:hypothetical protein
LIQHTNQNERKQTLCSTQGENQSETRKVVKTWKEKKKKKKDRVLMQSVNTILNEDSEFEVIPWRVVIGY